MTTERFTLECPHCGKSFKQKKPNQVFCTVECRNKNDKKLYKERRLALGEVPVCTGTVGAMHELYVCVYLMSKGYHVFRAQSPSCPCDLMIFKTSEIKRVEVTTGQIGRTGGITYPPKIRDRYDILAVVIGTEIRFMDPDGKDMEV